MGKRSISDCAIALQRSAMERGEECQSGHTGVDFESKSYVMGGAESCVDWREIPFKKGNVEVRLVRSGTPRKGKQDHGGVKVERVDLVADPNTENGGKETENPRQTLRYT